jgi:hypothetical protein
MNWFTICSGYPISFTGPLCSQAYVDRVENYLPYYVITNCIINSDGTFCNLMGDLFNVILYESDQTCLKCYQEYAANLAAIKDVNRRIECNKDDLDGVWTDACTQFLADALANFTICSGKSMNVAPIDIQSLQSLLKDITTSSTTISSSSVVTTINTPAPSSSRTTLRGTYIPLLIIIVLLIL